MEAGLRRAKVVPCCSFLVLGLFVVNAFSIFLFCAQKDRAINLAMESHLWICSADCSPGGTDHLTQHELVFSIEFVAHYGIFSIILTFADNKRGAVWPWFMFQCAMRCSFCCNFLYCGRHVVSLCVCFLMSGLLKQFSRRTAGQGLSLLWQPET